MQAGVVLHARVRPVPTGHREGPGDPHGARQPPLPVASPWLRGGHSLPGVAGGSAPRTCCWTVVKPRQPGWATPPGTGWFCKRPKPEGRAPEGLLWGPLSPDPLGTQSTQCTSRPPLGHPPMHARRARTEGAATVYLSRSSRSVHQAIGCRPIPARQVGLSARGWPRCAGPPLPKSLALGWQGPACESSVLVATPGPRCRPRLPGPP